MYFLLLGFVLLCGYWLLKRRYNLWRNLGVKQTDPPIIFGDNYEVFTGKKSVADSTKSFYDMFPEERYSGIYKFFLPLLIIRDPEIIKQITIKDFDHFTDHRAFVDPESEPLFAKNLLWLKGQQWKDMRATLTGSFTSSKMKVMFGLISEAAESFVDYFTKQNGDVHEEEMKDVFTRFTTDVIATTAFGVKVNSLGDKNNEFYVMGKHISEIAGTFKRLARLLIFFISVSVFKLLNLRIFDKSVTDFFQHLVQETIKIRQEKNIFRPDMIHILMEAQKEAEENERKIVSNGESQNRKFLDGLTLDDITAQAMIFFFAGFDSVSSLMTFVAYELAVNQKVQDKLRMEIKETLTKCHGTFTYDDLFNMKYLDMVITETVRKWPPFASTDRICTKPYTIEPKRPNEKPLTIKKGWSVIIPIIGIHRDPQYYPNPDKFDPERFSNDNKDKLVPYTYLGFGAGPRNCIGSRFAQMEVKIVFFHLLNNFKLITTKKTQIPLQLSKKFTVNIRPEKGLWLGIEKI